MIKIPNFKLPEEDDEGNIEYKREILDFEKRSHKYSSQMIYRLNEGNGIAYYYLGVYDNGTFYNWSKSVKNESLKNLIDIVTMINANIEYILEFNSGYKVKISSNKFKSDFLW